MRETSEGPERQDKTMAEKNARSRAATGHDHPEDPAPREAGSAGTALDTRDRPPRAAPRSAASVGRIRQTPAGTVRLTPTEMQILSFLRRHEGHPCSKAQIAAALGKNEKTVDRLLSRMRRNQIVDSQAVHAANGAQLANVYRVID